MCKSNLIILNEKMVAAATSLVLMVTNIGFSVFFMLVMAMELEVVTSYCAMFLP
jgi:hypothetical protein